MNASSFSQAELDDQLDQPGQLAQFLNLWDSSRENAAWRNLSHLARCLAFRAAQRSGRRHAA